MILGINFWTIQKLEGCTSNISLHPTEEVRLMTWHFSTIQLHWFDETFLFSVKFSPVLRLFPTFNVAQKRLRMDWGQGIIIILLAILEYYFTWLLFSKLCQRVKTYMLPTQQCTLLPVCFYVIMHPWHNLLHNCTVIIIVLYSYLYAQHSAHNPYSHSMVFSCCRDTSSC